MNSALGKTICFWLALILLPLVSQSSITSYEFQLEKISMFSSESNDSANFSTSGESGVAISGEPAHIGDSLRASVLVSNSGNSSASATLYMENTQINETFEGAPIEISPGSTREVSVIFSPNSNGSNSYRWAVTSSDGSNTDSLEGVFSVQALPKQIVDVIMDSYEWGNVDGLEVEASVYLSPGSPRTLQVNAAVEYQGSITTLQSIILEADPGRRALEFHLGQPIADKIFIEAIPLGWELTADSQNFSQLSIEMPSVNPSSLSVQCQFNPTEPEPGSKVISTITLTNEDSFKTQEGNVRVILSSDRQILAETSVQSVIPGGAISSDVSIPSWPDGERVEIEIEWTAGPVKSTSFFTIESDVRQEGIDVPFDITSAAIGLLGGILVILIGTLVWRAVSTRTPSTSEIGLRETKESSEARSRIEKTEISCTFCEQRLMVPAGHSGGVRCPSCSMEFRVGEEEHPPRPPVSRSNEDNLGCPECNQALRVPIEKRPVMSRCPVCKTEFMAEKGGR
ncbi:MAG: hypothetical protein CMA88_01645 [Euryarchaeota archaeon]|nr:hypothetical protein [Euryarchaeota archaeon]